MEGGTKRVIGRVRQTGWECDKLTIAMSGFGGRSRPGSPMVFEAWSGGAVLTSELLVCYRAKLSLLRMGPCLDEEEKRRV